MCAVSIALCKTLPIGRQLRRTSRYYNKLTYICVFVLFLSISKTGLFVCVLHGFSMFCFVCGNFETEILWVVVFFITSVKLGLLNLLRVYSKCLNTTDMSKPTSVVQRDPMTFALKDYISSLYVQ